MKAFIPDEMIQNAIYESQCITTDFTLGNQSTIKDCFYLHFTMEDNTDVIALEARLSEWNYNFY